MQPRSALPLDRMSGREAIRNRGATYGFTANRTRVRMTRQSLQRAREHFPIPQAGEFEPGPISVPVPIAIARTVAISADYRSRWLVFFTGMLLLLLNGCATTATQQLATNVSAALANQDDPALVRDGAPCTPAVAGRSARGKPRG